MQFRGVAENARGDSFEFQFTSPDWNSAVESADIALFVEVEADAHRKKRGPWCVTAVTLPIEHRTMLNTAPDRVRVAS
jgi:hypothetical protein